MPNMIENLQNITTWFAVSSLIQMAGFIGVCLHALQRRRNASSTILWIFIAWFLPILGPILYLMFGIDQISDKGLKKKVTDQLIMSRTSPTPDRLPFMAWHHEYRSPVQELANPLSRKLNRTIDAMRPELPLLDGNHLTPLISGTQAYPHMLKAIKAAKHHIHMQSFIFSSDAVGTQFMEALKAKAEEGVTVRLMYDRFGSTKAFLCGFFRKYRNIPNFQMVGWTQANPLKRQFQINLRNHRKNLVIDGCIAFFGGVNISQENRDGETAAIRDYHFMAKGPIVHELQYSFFRDWYFMTEEPIHQLLSKDHFPTTILEGPARLRIIDSGPTSQPGLAGEAFFNAIALAEEQILLVTPYFAPPIEILKALRFAARRGVDVRLILPKENNHLYAGLASKALYAELLETGVRIFEREPPFIHAKAMIIDNSIALIGSANLDVRSIELNYETTVLVDDAAFIGLLKPIILEDLYRSTELNLNSWLKRPVRQQIIENICSLLTPLL
jgi:cardiolipin synthase A/B